MAQTRGEVLADIRRKTTTEVIPGAETTPEGMLRNLSQGAIEDFLRTITEMEMELRGSGDLDSENLARLRSKFLYMSGLLAGVAGVDAIDAALTSLESEVIPPPAAPTTAEIETPIEDLSRVQFLARFIHDIRFYAPDFLLGLGVDGVDGDRQETLPSLADLLTRMDREMEFRVEVERQFYHLFHYWFGEWMDDSFARIGGPTTKKGDSYPMPKDEPPTKPFFSVSHDTEQNADRTFEGILKRLPRQFTPLSGVVSTQLKAKLALYGTSVRYASSNKSRAPINNYLEFIGADSQKNMFDGFRWTWNLANEGYEGMTKSDDPAEKKEELIKLQEQLIQGDLIRLAFAIIDTVGYDLGKEDGVTEKELNRRLFDQVVEQVQWLYARYLGRAVPAAGGGVDRDATRQRLTKVEQQFVKECVQWAFIYVRNLGGDIAFDQNAVDSEVSQMMRAREYHVFGGKNVSGTGHKEYSREVGRILARAVLPMEEHVYGVVRVPRAGLDIAPTTQVFFRNLQTKYGPDKWYTSNEYLNAMGMIPPSMVKDDTAATAGQLDYAQIDRHFVAIKLHPEYRALGYDEFGATEGYIFLPRTHVLGIDDPASRFYGIHASFANVARLRPKYFDADIARAEGGKDYAGRLIIASSFPDSATPYYTYLQNSIRLYEIGVVSKSEVLADIGEINITMARYPSDDVIEHLFRIPMAQRIDVIRRSVPNIGTTKAGFNYHRDMEAREHRVNHHFDVATSSPIGESHYKAMGLTDLFSSNIKYIVDNTLSDNARRTIDTSTGEVKPGNPKSLEPLRKMFRDIIEPGKRYFQTDAHCLPQQLHEYIERYERTTDSKEEKRLLFAIRAEMLFLCLNLYLSKYEPRPLPSDAKLQDYHKLEVRTYSEKRKPMGPREVKKFRSIVASYITWRIYQEIPADQRERFTADFHYGPDDLVGRIDEILEYYGIVNSFEAAVQLLQFEVQELEKIPLITDLHKKPAEKKE